jgi:diguanylate cyclase (GGDEF)-like protein
VRSLPRPQLRFGLLGTFALISAVPVLLLGLVLATVLGNQIRDRSINSTVQGIEFATQVAIGRDIGANALKSGDLSHRAVEDVKAATGSKTLPFARVNVWSKEKLVYSSDKKLVGTSIEPSDELAEALSDNEPTTEILHASQPLKTEQDNRDILKTHGDLLEVYVPFHNTGHPPRGAFEVYLPYKPLADTIRADTNRLYLILIVGLSLLYAIVFRVVARASRKLRTHGKEMSAHLERTKYESEHDPLTHLPNRTLFRARAVDAIVASRRTGEHAALLLIDLDRFKEINDTLGHQSGDLLLQAIGPRLEKILHPSDLLARFGGDEFGILLPQIPDTETALVVARSAHKMLEQPFAIQGLTLDVEASIGIAMFPDHAQDFEELMQHADVAMYLAKGKRTGYEVYMPADDDADAGRLTLAGDLRDAVDRHELVLHYQPKVNLRSGRVIGAEALMRWHHPGQGMIMPDRFIPLAERSGLIRSLTVFAIETAVRECRRWIDAGASLSVSVNLSTRDLIDIQLPEEVSRLLEQWRVPASSLELEITESVLMADPSRAREVVARLGELGVKVSIDDFGSGYSSLGYLNRLAVNDLKIDKSFVLNMIEDAGDAVIVQSTIDLAHNLGLQVVAEGVETQQAYDRLRSMGCDTAQGYFISRPMPGGELVEWVGEHGKNSLRAA